MEGAAPEQPSVAGFFENTLSFSLRKVSPAEFIVATPHEGLSLMKSSPVLDEMQTKLESRHKIPKFREARWQLAGH